MKKIICAALCLCVLLTIVITTVFADVPAIVQHPTPSHSISGKTVTVKLKGAPAKSGYYSYALVKVTATFRYGNGTPMAGKTYTKSASDSAYGDWGKKTRDLKCSVTGSNTLNDTYVSNSIVKSGLYQYYGIRGN